MAIICLRVSGLLGCDVGLRIAPAVSVTIKIKNIVTYGWMNMPMSLPPGVLGPYNKFPSR